MESFKLVSASRVTPAVGSLCLRKKVTLDEGTKLVRVNSLASVDNFSDLAMRNRTKTEHFPVLCLCHFIL